MRGENCGDNGDKLRSASRLGDVMKRPKRVPNLRRILSSVANSESREAVRPESTRSPGRACRPKRILSRSRPKADIAERSVGRCRFHPPHFDKSLMTGHISHHPLLISHLYYHYTTVAHSTCRLPPRPRKLLTGRPHIRYHFKK